MDLDSRIKVIHERAFDYESTLKNLNRTQDEVDTLRKLVLDFIPQFLSDKYVSMEFKFWETLSYDRSMHLAAFLSWK
jgi:hypothetical protein